LSKIWGGLEPLSPIAGAATGEIQTKYFKYLATKVRLPHARRDVNTRNFYNTRKSVLRQFKLRQGSYIVSQTAAV